MAARLGSVSFVSYPFLLLVASVACSSSPGTADTGGGGNPSVGGGGANGAGTSGLAGAPIGGDGGRAAGGTAGAPPAAGGDDGGAGRGGASPDDGGGSNGGGVGEYGFDLRDPGEKDLDWLCTFGGASTPAFVYVRLHQTGTSQTGIAMTPVYMPELAQLSIDGKVSTLEGVEYDYGGGHHNDSLSFEYDGERHSYYHSSFGFGFRACRPMDCRDVYELGAPTPKTEGCAGGRALPEVCVAVEANGSHAPLTDSFMKCPGDQF